MVLFPAAIYHYMRTACNGHPMRHLCRQTPGLLGTLPTHRRVLCFGVIAVLHGEALACYNTTAGVRGPSTLQASGLRTLEARKLRLQTAPLGRKPRDVSFDRTRACILPSKSLEASAATLTRARAFGMWVAKLQGVVGHEMRSARYSDTGPLRSEHRLQPLA